MGKNYFSESWHIQDQGLFTELAKTLAPHVGRITYSSPWINAFPSSKDVEVGEGNADFERVDSIAQVKNETDLFIFPDIYYGEDQLALVEEGKRVWGSRNGDELEIYREEAKEHFKSLGIPQGPYEVVKGITELRKYIKSQGDQKLWVKIEKTRGDTETFCVEGYDLYKNKLDGLEYDLGPKAEIMTFIVEVHLKDTIDLAIDTHSVDGVYPSVALLGTEEKGECYICVRKKWTEMPPILADLYTKLSGTLKGYEYRNFLSLESRMKKNEITLGDPCCRAGSPPMELELNMITNIHDIIRQGADGIMVDPDIASKYGIMLNIHSDWADKHPLMIDYPKEIRERLKFRYDSTFDGKTWIMPQGAGPRVAAIVGHGDNLDDLIEQAKEDSGKLKGIQVEAFTRSFPIALEKIKQFKEWGITF